MGNNIWVPSCYSLMINSDNPHYLHDRSQSSMCVCVYIWVDICSLLFYLYLLYLCLFWQRFISWVSWNNLRNKYKHGTLNDDKRIWVYVTSKFGISLNMGEVINLNIFRLFFRVILRHKGETFIIFKCCNLMNE
jgi:hypothetical protein